MSKTDTRREQVAQEVGSDFKTADSSFVDDMHGHAEEMRVLAATLESDIARLTGPDAEEAKGQLLALQQEVKEAETSLWQRIAELAAYPVAKVKAYVESRQERALAIPDNPKIILEITQELHNAKAYGRALRKKLEKQGVERFDADRQVDIDPRYSEEVNGAYTLFLRAQKKDQGKWENATSLFDGMNGSRVYSLIMADRLEEALDVWDKLSDGLQEERVKHVADTIVSRQMEKLKIGDFLEPTIGNFLKRKHAFNTSFGTLRTSIRVPYLREALALAADDQKASVFSSYNDRFLLSQDEVCVAALISLEDKNQERILDEWRRGPQADLWEYVLSHKEVGDLARLYLRYPILKQSLRPEKMSEVLTMYSIKDIDSLFEKVASKYPDYAQLTGPEFDGIMAMLSLDIDGDAITGLDTIKLESIGALSRVYSRDQLKELLSNENIADYKEISAQYLSAPHDVKDVFAKKVGPAVARFFAKVPDDEHQAYNVAQRRDGTHINLYAGIQGKTGIYIRLQEILALIPGQFHEPLFALLSPGDGSLVVPRETVLEECVQNFIIYQQEISGDPVTLADLFQNKELFADERWKHIKNGIEFFKQQGLLEVVKHKPYALTLFESAGNATDEQINTLVATYIGASDVVVFPISADSKKNTAYKQLERSKECVDGVYVFDTLCQQVFAHDAKEMATFFDLSDFDFQIITSFLSKELGKKDYIDMPAIEGEMARIGWCIRDFPKELLDKMLAVDTGRKQTFLSLRKMYPDTPAEYLFTYVESGQGGVIVESHKKLNLRPVRIEHAAKLSEIGDPGILFYFHSILEGHIDEAWVDHIVKKCQELDELGLSRRMYLTKPASQDEAIGWRNNEAENFLSVPSAFIVNAIEILHKYGFKPSLKSMTYLDSSEDMAMLERRVRAARAMGETYVSKFGDVMAEEILITVETRLHELQQVLPETKMDAQDISRCMRIDQETLTVLLGEPTILRFFIESAWNIFPGFSVSKELLEHPLFWQVEIPSEIYADAELFARHVAFLKHMNDCGEKVRPLKDVNEWMAIYEKMEQIHSVFGADALKSQSFDVLSEFTQKDVEKFRDFTTFFSSKEAGGYKVREVMEHMEQWTPEKRALFTEVRVLCGGVLPCDSAESLDKHMDGHATAEEVVAAMDKEGVYNYYHHKWAAFRMNIGLPEYVAGKYPNACKIFRSSDMVLQLAELQQCEEVTLQHLDRLAAYASENENHLSFRYFSENILLIAKHAQFDTIFEFIQARDTPHDSLVNLSIDELREFCDGIHSETLGAVAAVCEYGEVQLKDCTAFLRHPDDVSRFIVFAKKMYDIFGKKISPQDFYLMDVEHINKTLAYIDEHTLSALTEDSLKRILAVSEGNIANEIRLVLASFDSTQSISTGDALKRLQSVPKEFQWSIIKTKASNFGWELLDETDRLYQLGLTDAQFEELWVSLHKKLGLPEKKPIDARTAGILLKHGSSDYYGGNKKVIAHILSYRSEPIEKYYDLFTAHKKLVGESMAWGSTFPDVWTDDVCLSLFLESNYEGFIKELHVIKPEFITAHSQEIIAGIKLASAANGIEFLMKCCKGEVPLSSEDIALLTNEVHARTLTSSAQDCHTLLYKSMDGVVVLTQEQQSALANAYLLSGGMLPDKQYGDGSDNKAHDTIMARAEAIVQGWKQNIDGAILVLSKLLKQKKFTNTHLDMLHAIMTDTDAMLGAKSHKDIHHVFIEYLIYVNPTIKETINNNKKLGRLKDVVINKIIEYIQSLHASGTTDHQEIQKQIGKKLQEISRVFGSSDTKESDKRLVFMDMYHLKNCNDPAMKDLSAEEIAVRLRQDVEEVVALSGSEAQIRNMRRQIEFMPDSEEKKDAEKKLSTMLDVMQHADERNRQISDYLPPGALTHGFSQEYLELSLEYGNVSGELLGPDTKTDVSGLLGVDVSKVIGEHAAEQSFVERYQTLRNGRYGDIVLVYGDYTNPDRTPYYSGAIGPDHFLVRAGIPTSEVTSIILRNNDADILDKAKKAVATKGLYIPLVNTEGSLLFTQEEYDRMRVFYHSLHKKGYPREVIDNVYSYVTAEKGEKHQAVMDTAQAYIQNGAGKIDVDLAVLVDFLRTNDLNERPPEWYRQQSFETLYTFIKKTVGRKKRSKARGELFGKEFATSFDRRVVSGEEMAVEPERQRNAFIDAFLERQIPFVYGEGVEASFEKKVFESDLTSMLFREKTPKAILDIARRFSEFKKDFMRKLWSAAWDNIDATDSNEEDMAAYKKCIVPAVVGSVGRGEVVLGSDLDYLLYVDDVSESLTGEQLETLKHFINNKLGPEMNRLLEENGIHADAGLAKADRVPFTLLSTIRDFTIDLTQSRQVEEPTNMLDSEALFSDQSETVASAKELLLVENKTAHLLDSYIAKDLEIGTDTHPGYQAQFEKLYASVASGELMKRVKESLQRAVIFKLYYLLFEGFNSGKIPKEKAGDIPASVDGKINVLTEHRILSQSEARICRDLVAFAYKLRFLGEVYSEEAKQQKQLADKVTNVTFRLDDISYDERLTLVGLLKEFKSTILYK